MSDTDKDLPKTEQPENEFEIAFRVLGNELLAFSLRANNFTNKWLLAGLLSVAVIVGVVATFGSDIVALFTGLQ